MRQLCPRPALAVPAPGAAGRPGPGWLALGGLLLRVREAPGDTEAGRSGLQARPRRGAQASARLGTRESPPGRSVEDAEAKLEARTRRRERAFPGLRLRNDRPGREQGRRRWERAQRRLRGTHPAVPGARPLTWSAPEPPPEWAVGLMSRRDFKESGGAFPSAHTALAGHTGSDSNVAPPGKPNWTRGSASFQLFSFPECAMTDTKSQLALPYLFKKKRIKALPLDWKCHFCLALNVHKCVDSSGFLRAL